MGYSGCRERNLEDTFPTIMQTSACRSAVADDIDEMTVLIFRGIE
jgi:hypothetical protein